jgi:hypothetical protein
VWEKTAPADWIVADDSRSGKAKAKFGFEGKGVPSAALDTTNAMG